MQSDHLDEGFDEFSYVKLDSVSFGFIADGVLDSHRSSLQMLLDMLLVDIFELIRKLSFSAPIGFLTFWSLSHSRAAECLHLTVSLRRCGKDHTVFC